MKKRKFLAIGSLFFVMLFGVLAGSCKSCQEDTPDTTITPTITMPEKGLLLNKKEISILLGESDYVLVEKVGIESNVPIAFSSSDESVATVNDIGVIQAINVGTAIITVKADGVEENCTVNVTLGKYLPEISLKQINGDSATIGADGALNFDPVVIFNHQEYTDATYTYQVEDKTVGTVENGIFTATGKIGSTSVTVYANWRGQSGEKTVTLRKTVTVTVSIPVIELYTTASFAGETYATSANILSMIKDENATDIQTSVLTGSEIITVSGTQITANTYGKASIVVTYKNAAAQTVEKRFDVTVQRPVAEYLEPINFSILDGDLPLTALWGREVEISEAYFGTPIWKGEELTVTDGKITAGISLSGKESERKTVTLLTETEGYTVDICVYTKLIDDVNDLLMFNLVDNDITGVYLVTKDLDASEAMPTPHADIYYSEDGDVNENGNSFYDFDYKFTGTFDGGGHTLTLNVMNGGFFGVLKDATVRNANFILNISGKPIKDNYFPTGLAHQATNTTISNVYAELKPTEELEEASSRRWALSLIMNLSNAQEPVITKNLVVVNRDDFANLQGNTTAHWVGGALFYADAGRTSVALRDNQMENVFVIAPNQLGNGYYLPMAGGTQSQTFASNDTVGKEAAAQKTEKTQYAYANATRYTDLKGLCASVDLSVFPSYIVKMIAVEGITVEVDGTDMSDGIELPKGEWTPIRLKVGHTVLSDVRLQTLDEAVAIVENGSVKVDNFGVTTITATGKAFNTEITVTFSVTAKVDVYEQELLFSGADGVVDMQAVFGEEATLINAYGMDGTVYTVVDGKITDLTNDTNAALTKTLILETTEHQLKKVTLKVYTKLLDEASDLTVFALTNKDVTGCYLVIRDIDASTEAANAHTDLTNNTDSATGGTDWDFDYAFTGTFDGGGHTIIVNTDKGGLFGNLKNATVTNCNFVFYVTGARKTNTDKWPTGLAYLVDNATVSNIYAELNPTATLTAATERTWSLSLVVNAYKTSKFENVVVINNDNFTDLQASDAHWVSGALFYADAARADGGARDTLRTNVFVIAPEKLGNGYYVPMSGGTTSQVFASNDADGLADASGKIPDKAQYTYAGVTRYTTVQEFVSSEAWKNVIPDFIMRAINGQS